MRRVILAAQLAFVLLAPRASAGVVLFDPPEVAFDPSDPNRTYQFEVTIDQSPGGQTSFGTLDMLFVSLVVEFQGFDYSQEFLDQTLFQGRPPIDWCGFAGCPKIFENGLSAGGFALAPVAFPIVMGTLTTRFDLSRDWMDNPPAYAMFVDSEFDGGFSTLNGVEPLAGYVRLVPEPATALLLLGAVCMMLARRRFRA